MIGTEISKWFWILLLLAPFFSFLLDLMIGDPLGIVHPVVLMGKAVAFFEERLRKCFPKTRKGERTAGAILAVVLPLTVLLLILVVYALLLNVFKTAGLWFVLVLEVFWGYQSIAVKDMLRESGNVYNKLSETGKEQEAGFDDNSKGQDACRVDDGKGQEAGCGDISKGQAGCSADDGKGQEAGCGDMSKGQDACREDNNKNPREDGLENARRAVGRIVGRDTASLSREGIIKATVESVAESFSDGVFAPMLYLSVFGAPGAMCYKAINTMDSMVGYKNQKYLDFGRAAAKLDDAANFVPSRLAALAMIVASYLTSKMFSSLGSGDTAGAKQPSRLISGKRAFDIWKRDRRNHASPNSAQTESAMAGALGIELGGGAYYFGEYYDKPKIGDPIYEPDTTDILRANRIFFITSLLSSVICLAFRMLLCHLVSR